LRVIHFYNGRGGGIHSVINNLISLNKDVEVTNEVVYIIEKKNQQTFCRFEFDSNIKEHFFHYDKRSNLYKQFKHLATIIHDESAILVAHDWYELGMISQLALKNPVISILHGNYEYYYELYKKHKNAVSIFLCVSNALRNKLISDYNGVRNKIFHYSYPVKNRPFYLINQDKISIVFVASNLADPNKNLRSIQAIDLYLIEQRVYAEWHIIGAGIELTQLQNDLGISPERLFHYANVNNVKMDGIYSKANIFLMPSFNEGLPVSLVEAMKNGLVPIVNSWNGSAQCLIETNVHGYVVHSNEPKEYSQHIIYLSKTPRKMIELSLAAYNRAHQLHDESLQIIEFKTYLKAALTLNTIRKKEKIYGSRLDSPLIPAFLTKTLRIISSKLS
jgi:glycosyltransferase involved in cell wall biosynthesis